MTAPKQEKWIHAECGRLNIKFAAAIGAVFDFYTGRVKRSHPVFQGPGLEWLPRLSAGTAATLEADVCFSPGVFACDMSGAILVR
jgi:UDP-N-acetyl-D-mannosaminuronic acid transferase (WecB/TagA/CpsF family)